MSIRFWALACVNGGFLLHSCILISCSFCQRTSIWTMWPPHHLHHSKPYFLQPDKQSVLASVKQTAAVLGLANPVTDITSVWTDHISVQTNPEKFHHSAAGTTLDISACFHLQAGRKGLGGLNPIFTLCTYPLSLLHEGSTHYHYMSSQ